MDSIRVQIAWSPHGVHDGGEVRDQLRGRDQRRVPLLVLHKFVTCLPHLSLTRSTVRPPGERTGCCRPGRIGSVWLRRSRRRSRGNRSTCRKILGMLEFTSREEVACFFYAFSRNPCKCRLPSCSKLGPCRATNSRAGNHRAGSSIGPARF